MEHPDSSPPPRVAGPQEVLSIFRRQVVACLEQSRRALSHLESTPDDADSLGTLGDVAEMICDLAMVHGYEDIEALAHEIQCNAQRALTAKKAVTSRWIQNISEAVEAVQQMVEHDEKEAEAKEVTETDGVHGSQASKQRFHLAEEQSPSSAKRDRAGRSHGGSSWSVSDGPEHKPPERSTEAPAPGEQADRDTQASGAPRSPSESEELFDIVEDESLFRLLKDNDELDYPDDSIEAATPDQDAGIEPSAAGSAQDDEEIQAPVGESSDLDLLAAGQVDSSGPQGSDDYSLQEDVDENDIFAQVFAEDLAARLKTLRLFLEQIIEDKRQDSGWEHIANTLHGLRENAYRLDVGEIHEFTSEFIDIINRVFGKPLLRDRKAVEAVRLGIEYLQAYLDRDPALAQKREFVRKEFHDLVPEAQPSKSSSGAQPNEPVTAGTPARKNGYGIVAKLKDVLTRRLF